MAERRMFAKSIVDSDVFLDMSLSTQALYFHLAMRADDDGFVNNPKKVMRMIGACNDDFKILLAKRYVLGFESGVVVIKHWKIHNYIQKDRYKETLYKEEKTLIETKLNSSYTECIQNVSNLDTQVRLGKVSQGEESKEKSVVFTPPSLTDVSNYIQEQQMKVDANAFIDFYESKGWFIGKNKMKDWKAALRNWNRKDREVINGGKNAKRFEGQRNEDRYDSIPTIEA